MMKRNYKDLIERAVTAFVITFVGVWAALNFDFTLATLKGALIGTIISLAKNLALQGKATQTPVAEVKVEDRIDPNMEVK